MADGSNRRWKFWLFRVLLPCLAALVVMLYLGLIFWPTGFQEYEESHVAAIAKVNSMIGEHAPDPVTHDPANQPETAKPAQTTKRPMFIARGGKTIRAKAD